MKYLLLILFSLQAKADLVDTWTGTLYIMKNTVTLAWDAAPAGETVTYWEVQATWLHPTQPSQNIVYDYGTTTTTSITLTQRRAGFFVFRVRACNTVECSAWTESIGVGSTVNGVAGVWRVWWQLPSPIIIIE